MRRIAAIVVVLALAGCGGGSDESDATKASGEAPQQTISISETEFRLEPSTVNVARPGTVSFSVMNEGQVVHALEIEGNGVEEETEEIEPGESATLTVQLDRPGTYEIYCPVDGHEAKGMKGVIRVAGSSGAGTNTRGSTGTDDEREDETTTGRTSTEGATTEDGPGY